MQIDIYFHPDFRYTTVDHFYKMAGDIDGFTSNKVMSKNYTIFIDCAKEFIRLISWEN